MPEFSKEQIAERKRLGMSLSSVPLIYNKHYKDIPDNAVLCDRTTKWGNPFRFPTSMARDRDESIWLFWLHVTVGEGKDLPFKELYCKNLVCWCAPNRCHCEVLRAIANNYPILCPQCLSYHRFYAPHFPHEINTPNILGALSVDGHVYAWSQDYTDRSFAGHPFVKVQP